MSQPHSPKPDLIRAHGGYRQLKSFQQAELVYDASVKFCDRFTDKRSRTHDQMVQAARSGRQNIAEGSQASGTSKKTGLKLDPFSCTRKPSAPRRVHGQMKPSQSLTTRHKVTK
ncbi:MAG TPA: hypothetical protein VGQ39_21015 [Pyrinomonadaceae bacterium]|nr:hypothetical protein [Pyrinomonadaceae bacterium]